VAMFPLATNLGGMSLTATDPSLVTMHLQLGQTLGATTVSDQPEVGIEGRTGGNKDRARKRHVQWHECLVQNYCNYLNLYNK